MAALVPGRNAPTSEWSWLVTRFFFSSCRLSEGGLFYSGCKVHGTSLCRLTGIGHDGLDPGDGGMVSPLPAVSGGGGDVDGLDLDMSRHEDDDVDESDGGPNETTAFNPSNSNNNNTL